MLDADLKRTYVLTSPPVVLYCGLVALFSGAILRIVYGPEYTRYDLLVVLFAVYYVLLHVVYLLTSALNAKRLTRPLFRGNVYAAVLGLVLGWLLVAALGVNGAAIGMIAGAVVLILVFWRAYRTPAPATVSETGENVAAAPQP
jgi:O-antigen/teichoic acid export membrane protein